MITFPFFLNTWEEYQTGELILPRVHGVSEGTLLIIAIEATSGICGSSFWYQTITLFSFEIRYNLLVILLSFVAGMFFGLMSLVNVLRNQKINLFKALQDCLGYICLVSSYLSVIYFSNSTIVKERPKLLILTYGFQFAKMLGLLQLAHIKNSAYKPLYFTTVFPIGTLCLHSIIYFVFEVELLCEIDFLIIVFCIWNFVSWLHFVYFCSEEMCVILNIKRFSLGRRKNQRIPIQITH